LPIKKKGDRDRCEIYRGTALGNVPYKILVNIILEKMKLYVEKFTWECENGFRDRRSIIDNIFVLKIIN